MQRGACSAVTKLTRWHPLQRSLMSSRPAWYVDTRDAVSVSASHKNSSLERILHEVDCWKVCLSSVPPSEPPLHFLWIQLFLPLQLKMLRNLSPVTQLCATPGPKESGWRGWGREREVFTSPTGVGVRTTRILGNMTLASYTQNESRKGKCS